MTFGSPDSISDRLHRIDKFEEDSSGSPGTDLVEYDYNGTGRVSEASYLVPAVRSLFHGNDADGDYEGWDRFGRTKFQQWHKHSTPTGRVDRWDYTYDYAGNRLTRDLDPTEVSGAPTDHDQLFTYDGLHRLKTYDEGQLSGGAISSPTDEQDFTLDQLGNWTNLLEKTGGSTTLDQDRAHNKVNEIDDITTNMGAAWTDPQHDAAGNMITMPQPLDPTNNYTPVVYDAWNRLVSVNMASTEVVKNEYDGLNQRIVKDVNGGDTFDYYYNDEWQVLEERKNGDPDPLSQYVWHPYYIDALAVRYYDENTDNSGIVRHWYLQDANFNVTAVVNDSAAVLERYQYTPYGEVTFLEPDFDPIVGNASAIGNNVLYTGRERDPETGLQLNRERWYHPPLGRWLTRDPIGYEGSLYNLYEYVGSAPLQRVDPQGTDYFTGQRRAWLLCNDLCPSKCGDTTTIDEYKTCMRKCRDDCDKEFPDHKGPEITRSGGLCPTDCIPQALDVALTTACCELALAGCIIPCSPPAVSINPAGCLGCLDTARKIAPCCLMIPAAQERLRKCLLGDADEVR